MKEPEKISGMVNVAPLGSLFYHTDGLPWFSSLLVALGQVLKWEGGWGDEVENNYVWFLNLIQLKNQKMRHFTLHDSGTLGTQWSFTLILLITGWHWELLKTLHELFLFSVIIHVLLPSAFSGVSFLFLLPKRKESKTMKPKLLPHLCNTESSPLADWSMWAGPLDTWEPAAAVAAAPSPWALSLLPQPVYLLLPVPQKTVTGVKIQVNVAQKPTKSFSATHRPTDLPVHPYLASFLEKYLFSSLGPPSSFTGAYFDWKHPLSFLIHNPHLLTVFLVFLSFFPFFTTLSRKLSRHCECLLQILKQLDLLCKALSDPTLFYYFLSFLRHLHCPNYALV